MALKEIGIEHITAGVVGALVSMRFINGSNYEKVTMALGGAAFSFFGSVPLARWADMGDSVGLFGFLIGLFGMALVSRIYEVIWVIDLASMTKDAWKVFIRKWKA